MPTPTIRVFVDQPGPVINPNLYGHFAEHLGACINDGIWVGPDSAIPNDDGIRTDVAQALKRLHPPVLRWPGGCFADDYHWQDGIGPRERRPRRVNIWWGDAIEPNGFGTHEFMRLCRIIGAEPYFCGNVGSGSPRELRDWVEYCNFAGDSTLAAERAANGAAEPFGVRWWGVGNENWGCGGNFCPEDYAVEYKRFSTYLRDFSGTPLSLIACGPGGNDPEWTRRFFTKLGSFRRINAFSAHYYCGTSGTATEYTVDQWYELIARSLRMESLIKQQRAILDGFDPERRIGLIVDEWGTWHPAESGRNPRYLWQQNTMRDALVAAATLDIFNRHADKVVMANIAQTINVLQAMILTEGDRMVLTPTYHVFDMYQSHQGGTLIPTAFEAGEIVFQAGGGSAGVTDAAGIMAAGQTGHLPWLSGSASVKDGVLTLSVVNAHASEPVEAAIRLQRASVAAATALELMHVDIHAHNTFDTPDIVQPITRALEPPSGEWRHLFYPGSVTVLKVKLG
jgi:alpha-N-arabinofuranosidase